MSNTIPSAQQLDTLKSGASKVASSLSLDIKKAKGIPLVKVHAQARCLEFFDRDQEFKEADRLLNLLAVLVLNTEGLDRVESMRDLTKKIDEATTKIDNKVAEHLDHVYKNSALRALEANWRGLAELVKQVETDEVIIDLLDVSQEELGQDLADHAGDIFSSALFEKVYVDEYDRYGGKPFGAMIGLYEFKNTPEDLDWLGTMGDVANAAHCPFISSAAPEFFDKKFKDFSELEVIGDIEAHLRHPRFGKWDELRDRDSAAYLSLTLPRYLLRRPWEAERDDRGNRAVKYTERVAVPSQDYLWGNSAILFARNMVRSFENSEWCQYIRGPKGGGLVTGLTVHSIISHEKEEMQSPVELDIADYREYQFARSGFNALVHRKDTASATFFSAQSIKKPKDFVNVNDTQNAYLVTNLAYTLSVTRIAHYVKAMMREYIGSSADGPYIQNTLQLWLNDYITTTVNPDDLTLRYYPFKAVTVSVVKKPGPLGWYKATIKILPHIQFEGMDVELQLEASLGGK